MIDWQHIDTVLLDMDGTLLDLNFDNHFWTVHVPGRYGAANNMTLEQAREQIFPHMLQVKGTLDWYNVHYWTDFLQMDVLAMKHEVADLVQPRPGALAFLEATKQAGKKLVLATNAHQDTLAIKFARSGIDPFFHHVVTSHELGEAKEQQGFWHQLQSKIPFDPDRTLFIDDNDHVLTAAADFGVKYLLSIHQPDLSQDRRESNLYPALDHFEQITPGQTS